MDSFKKLLLILFCGAFLVVRTKIAQDVQRQIKQDSLQRIHNQNEEKGALGKFVKK